MDYRDQLEEREAELAKLRKKVVARLENAPKGKLRIKHIDGHIRYFLRTESNDLNGKYLPRAKAKLIQMLAQKEYDEKALTAIDAELSVIKSCRRHWSKLPKYKVEKVYYSMAGDIREMITPLIETDQHFIKRWQESGLEKLRYKEEEKRYSTERGEFVRSKSEVVIANLLFKKGVPYKYEYPLCVCGRTVYPDFTVLDVKNRREVYWERFGVADDYEYALKAMQKMQEYSLSGLIADNRVIITAETAKDPLDFSRVSQIINSLAAA